jgi:hypothetical protein
MMRMVYGQIFWGLTYEYTYHQNTLSLQYIAPFFLLLLLLVEMHVRHARVFKNICYKAKILYVLKS